MKIKYYNVTKNGFYFFDPKIKNVIRIYYNIRKIMNGQRNYYTIIFISKNTMR